MKQRRRERTGLCVVLLVVVVLLPVRLYAQEPTTFTVLASTSLTEALSELVRIYSAESDTTVTAIFADPETLLNTIISGDSADLILLEDDAILNRLEQQGLLAVGTETIIAGNRLVFVASKSHRYSRKFLTTLPFPTFLENYDELEIVVPDPDAVATGRAIQQALEKAGVWKKFLPALVRAGSEKNALYLIAKGSRTGAVYYTETLNNPEVITLSEVPQDMHEPLYYKAAVVAGENMELGREFLGFLQSEPAKQLLMKRGFSVP